MPDTPDRAALAEGLREIRDAAAVWDRDVRILANMKAGFITETTDAAAAALAAPAVPPSVAEAVGEFVAWLEACSTPTSAELTYAAVFARLERITSAVRAATVAEAVRVVEGDPAWDIESGAYRDRILAALRALAERAP